MITNTSDLIQAAIVVLTKVSQRPDLESGKMLTDQLKVAVEALTDEAVHQSRRITRDTIRYAIEDAIAQENGQQ